MKIRTLFFGFTLCFLLVSNSFSQTPSDFPSLEPFIDFKYSSPTLTPRQIITSALYFSMYPNLDAATLIKYVSRYEELEARVKSERFQKYSDRVKAEEVLLLMYEKTLRRYSGKQTRLTKLFDDGTYNCVSSSILYLALAKAAGLQVFANRVPEHCFCSVLIDGNIVDVETTNPMGFNNGEKKLSRGNGSDREYAVINTSKYKGRYVISDAMLSSLVALNIGSMYIESKDYAESAKIAIARYAFIKDDGISQMNDGRFFLDLGITNFASILQGRNRYYDAMLWVESAIKRWGSSKELEDCHANTVYNVAIHYLNERKVDEADALIELHRNDLENKVYEELLDFAFVSRSFDDVQKLKSPDEKLSYLRKRKQNPRASKKKILSKLNELMEESWLDKINVLANDEKFYEAAELCNKALEDLPGDSLIRKQRQICLKNFDAIVHNKFADLVNGGRYADAEKTLNEGLKKNPESSVLKKDLAKLKKIMGN